MIFILKISIFSFLIFLVGCATEGATIESNQLPRVKYSISKKDLFLLEKNGFSRGYWSQDCQNSRKQKFKVIVDESALDSTVLIDGYAGLIERIYSIGMLGNNLFLLKSVISVDGMQYEKSSIYAYYSGNRKIIDASYNILNSKTQPVRYIKGGVQVLPSLKWMEDEFNSESAKYRFCGS